MKHEACHRDLFVKHQRHKTLVATGGNVAHTDTASGIQGFKSGLISSFTLHLYGIFLHLMETQASFLTILPLQLTVL